MSHQRPAFNDRRHAGRMLAGALSDLGSEDLVVLGLPRGGVPVAFEVAMALDCPLDVVLVRKLGVPWRPELAMGAIGEGGITVADPQTIEAARVDDQQFAAIERTQRDELVRRSQVYRAGHPRLSLQDRPTIIVDDGMATGSTAKAACEVVRAAGATSILLAVPVAPASTVRALSDAADDVIALATPHPFRAVGSFYRSFSQTPDQEVIKLLEAGRQR